MRGHDDDPFEHEPDSGEAGDARDPVRVSCPHCGESVEVVLDPESRGEMVQDCEVCCRPWLLDVSWTRDGRPIVRVEAM